MSPNNRIKYSQKKNRKIENKNQKQTHENRKKYYYFFFLQNYSELSFHIINELETWCSAVFWMFPERQCDSITYTISYTIVFFILLTTIDTRYNNIFFGTRCLWVCFQRRNVVNICRRSHCRCQWSWRCSEGVNSLAWLSGFLHVVSCLGSQTSVSVQSLQITACVWVQRDPNKGNFSPRGRNKPGF